jgi:tetratricopeptide (TPR) repeat protein
MEEATYTFGGAAKILDIAESKLRYWAQVGFVGPSGRRAGKPVYSFQDLVSVKAAKELTDRGFKAAEIRKAIEDVRASLPHLDRPLDRMRVAFDGTRLVIVDEGNAYEPTGQKVFDFGLGELARKVSGGGELRPVAVPESGPAQAAFSRMRSAYDWFVEGTRIETAGGADADARAEQCYREAVALDPGLAAARTNLGSLAYRRGDTAGAREAFEAALALDPDQPEARFNLANLVLEAGDLELAVAELRRVLQTTPDFADAHYNLAVALERRGRPTGPTRPAR